MATKEYEFGPLVRVLREHGYTVEVQPFGATKRCTVRGPGEKWETQGASGTAALNAAIRVMFPSAAARAALDAELGAGSRRAS